MKQNLLLISSLVLLLSSCKKDSKAPTNEIVGTWSVYSYSNVQGIHSFTAMASDYSCMSDIKMVFDANGAFNVPAFSKCYIAAPDAFGNAPYISHANTSNGKWSITGNTLHTSLFDNTQNKTLNGTLTLSNSNGKLQLTSVDTAYGAVLTEVYIKTQ